MPINPELFLAFCLASAALILMPAIMAGSALSRRTHAHIGGGSLRYAVLIFAVVSGAFLILRS